MGLRMPTKEERTARLKQKLVDIGVKLDGDECTNGSVDPPDLVAFLLGSIFEFHQLTTLPMKHVGGETLCCDLLGFDEAMKKTITGFGLARFLERNDEKRSTALLAKCRTIWSAVKKGVEDVVVAEYYSEDEDDEDDEDYADETYDYDEPATEAPPALSVPWDEKKVLQVTAFHCPFAVFSLSFHRLSPPVTAADQRHRQRVHRRHAGESERQRSLMHCL